MAKKRGSHRRNNSVRPDEYFSAGHIEFARFGKNIISRSSLDKEQFSEMQEKISAEFPRVVNQINVIVSEIVKLVRELPPVALLHRAWWELAALSMKLESEAMVDQNHTNALRMVDYIQSVIAAARPSNEQRAEVSDQEWAQLGKLVAELFHTITLDYQICRSTYSKKNDPAYDHDVDELRFRAEVYWCSVRGQRFQNHEQQALLDVLTPHSEIISELFGISSEQLVEGLGVIQRNLIFGLGEAFTEFDHVRKQAVASMKCLVESGETVSDPNGLMAMVFQDRELQGAVEKAAGRAFGIDLFDVEKAFAFPKPLLDELSWAPGEAIDFLAPGDFSGWPLRIWPVFQRLFLKVDGQYLCFDVYSLFDNFYRVMQKIVFRLKPEYKQEWNNRQQSVSEDLPFRYLQKILPESSVLRPIYYRWRTGSEGKTEWCELDGLLLAEDHLFVIEVKGGSFTYTPPATDWNAYINSIKALAVSPANQGRRFVDFLESSEAVEVFDAARQRIATLRRRDFRQVTVCAVSLDPFTEIAARLQHLKTIDLPAPERPVWSISIDDLRVYADIFTAPLVFLHFVEQRMTAAKSAAVDLDDELDHLGLYLDHNNYSQHAKGLKGDLSACHFLGYRSGIDKFFAEKHQGEVPTSRLVQKMPPRLVQVMGFLQNARLPRRAELVCRLLDLGGEARKMIDEGIEEQIKGLANGRPRPLATHGDAPVCIFCWGIETPRDPDLALHHARKLVALDEGKERTLIELTYHASGELVDLAWQQVVLTGLSQELLSRLDSEVAILRRARVAKAKRANRIGPNSPCPCGSGKKYKKCCRL